MPLTLGGIELYMGPTALGGPDDLDAAIRQFIAGAQHSLAIAVQELDSRAIAQSILDAEKRGVRVRIILEGDYLREDPVLADPWLSAGANEENRTIYGALLKSGVDVITDLNPKIFHQKFIVRDKGKQTAAVLTGSTNFTLTDSGKNGAGNNLNHVLVLHGAKPAEQYLAEFERMRAGTFGDLHERVEAKPREFTIDGVRIKPLFAPRHGPEMEIMKQMLKAQQSVDFVMFTFAQSSGIDDTMMRLRPLVNRMRGVLDREQGAQKWAATKPLVNAGIDLYKNKTGTGVRKVHHKLMVIDESLTIVGSFNYTEPANTLNDENIIVIGNLEETDPTALAAQRQLAGYALAEIDRIIDKLAVKA